MLAVFVLNCFSSCEKVIEIDLKETEPVIVIQANLTDIFQKQYVYVSQTSNFKEETKFKGISDAIVKIKDEDEQLTHSFKSESEGEYTSIFKGREGRTYTLTVEVNGKVYDAISYMPKKVTLDSISITEITLFSEKSKFIKVHYQDPSDIANYYNYVVFINDEKNSGIYVDSDRFSNGKYVSQTIFTSDPEIKVDDVLMLDFQNINSKVFRYFYALSQITGGSQGGPVAPSNPDSNISNGALGYFSTHTSEKRVFTVN